MRKIFIFLIPVIIYGEEALYLLDAPPPIGEQKYIYVQDNKTVSSEHRAPVDQQAEEKHEQFELLHDHESSEEKDLTKLLQQPKIKLNFPF